MSKLKQKKYTFFLSNIIVTNYSNYHNNNPITIGITHAELYTPKSWVLGMGLGISTQLIPKPKYSKYPDTQPIPNNQYPRY